MKTKDYNLLYEEWIPVLYHNGGFKRLGIIEALLEAHNIRQIAASNPMDRVAVIRFLLAILYWCKGNPTNDNSNPPDKFPLEWFGKLEENSECFNLFGDRKRFYQFWGYDKKKDKLLSANSIIHEIPTGTYISHFRHSRDFEHGLCPACCALGLVRLPVFTTQGGAGKAPGINFKPPVYLIPVGNSLLETLILSFKQVENLGIPSWMLANKQIPEKGDISFLAGFTSLPRRVWLDEPTELSKCINCGVNVPIVRKCVYVGVKKRKETMNWKDHHVVYYLDKKEFKPTRTDDPLKPWFKTNKPWTNLLSNVLGSDSYLPKNYLVVGFATDQVKFIDTWERMLTLEEISDNDELIHYLDKWDESVRKLPFNVRDYSRNKASGNERSIMRNIRPQIESGISAKLNDIIKNKINPWEHADSEYDEIMYSVAMSLSPGFISKPTSRRRNIMKVKPGAIHNKTSSNTIKEGGKK